MRRLKDGRATPSALFWVILETHRNPWLVGDSNQGLLVQTQVFEAFHGVSLAVFGALCLGVKHHCLPSPAISDSANFASGHVDLDTHEILGLPPHVHSTGDVYMEVSYNGGSPKHHGFQY